MDDFAKGHNNFPKNRQAALHLLHKHNKSVRIKPTISEGRTFVRKTKSAGDIKKVKFNHEFWKEKICHVCGKKGHPSLIHSKEEQEEAKAFKGKKAMKGNDTSIASGRSPKSQASSYTYIYSCSNMLKGVQQHIKRSAATR